jgi:UDP-3-O-[3-hydroxymyristoyl] glucosamine N-acyltransferase
VLLSQLCKKLDIEFLQDDKQITGLNTLQDATDDQVSFFQNKKYKDELEKTVAAAVLISKEYIDLVPSHTIALVCEEPYIKLAYASKYFAPKVIETDGNTAVVGKNSVIQNNAFLGKNTTIGSNTIIMANSTIGDNVTIGNNCIIYPNVTVYRDCIIGDSTIIHSGAVIGSDGFGFATDKAGNHIKIYQNGNVTIGDDVEIGANTTIDRAAFTSTIIEDKVHIDNLVQIGHNCVIKKGSVIAAQAGLAGSCNLEQYVVMGAQSGSVGHITIAPFTTISARGGVTKTITTPKKQWAGFPLMEHRTWLRLQGKIQKLLS